ncbi:SgcJ/EcaC family oxidoreductase [Caulobacter segnis]|uniref:SgcJ/EcaC family oxidoreductase n=1 Tax=Caulobacter segnis TaxID=88688 RepID=UPI00240F64F4|nr:SgcJ/EcaC family oxidoreductase [Caulobacter segnis]MDG2522605.1 SgcJ/EcaC family oxidoreductase [Caulobacter segnis]
MKAMLAMGAAVLAMVMAAPASAAPADDAAKLAVVQEMITAWKDQNWRKVADLFTQDGVLHSMMVEPVKGREAIYKRIAGLGEGVDAGGVVLDPRNLGVINGTVFLERVDRFSYKGHKGAVPVVGVMEFEGGLIKEWREYYDRAQLLSEMGVKADFTH